MIGVAFIFLPSNQMRRITSPTSHQHRCCRRSQRIESLAFSNLNRRDEHYRRRHWFTATSYNLLLSLCLCQHRRLPPPPSDDNQDDNEDDTDEDNKDEDDSDEDDEDEDDSNDDNDSEDGDEDEDEDDEYNIHDYNSDGNCKYCKYNYNDLHDDDDDDDDNNDDDDDENNIHDCDSDDNCNYNYDDPVNNNADDANTANDSNSDDDDSDNEDSDDSDDNDHSYDDDDNDDNDDHDKAASDLECPRTPKSIVRMLIVVLGPHFQVSYSPITRPDLCVITTLQDCIGLLVFFVDFALLTIFPKTY